MADLPSSMPSSKLTSRIWAPRSTCSRATDSASWGGGGGGGKVKELNVLKQ